MAKLHMGLNHTALGPKPQSQSFRLDQAELIGDVEITGNRSEMHIGDAYLAELTGDTY